MTIVSYPPSMAFLNHYFIMARQMDLSGEDLSEVALAEPKGVARSIRDKVIVAIGAEGLALRNDGLVEAVGEKVRAGVFPILRSLKGRNDLRPTLESLASSNLGRLEEFDVAYCEYARIFGVRSVDVAAFLRKNKVCARWQILKARGFIAGLSGQQSLPSEPVSADIEVLPGKRFFHYYVASVPGDFANKYWSRSTIHSADKTRSWRGRLHKLMVKGINPDCTLEVSYCDGGEVVQSFSKVEPQFLTMFNAPAGVAA